MKRKIATILSVAMLLSTLFGCGAKETPEDNPAPAPAEQTTEETQPTKTDSEGEIVLTMLETQPTEAKTALLNKMLDKFMAENPGVKVELISTPNDQAAEKLFNLAAANQLPDIMEMNDSWLAPLAAAGHIEDMNPYFNEWELKDDIVDAAVNLGTAMGGKMYFMPYGLWGTTVYYNTETLKAAGMEPPTTTEEFYEVAKASTEAVPDTYGYSLRGGLYGPTHAIMWMLSEVGSPYVINPETGKCVFDTPEAIEGLKKYAALYQDGYASPDCISWGFRECVEAFTTGSAAMVIQSNEVVQICNEKMGEGKFDTTMLPVGSSGKTFDTSGQTGYSMSAHSEHKEEAWKLLSFLLDPANCYDFIVSMGFTPINKSLADDPAFSEGPIGSYMEQVLSDKIEFAQMPTYLNEWGEVVGEYGTEQIQMLLLGQQTAEETGAALAEFLNEAEANYRNQ